MEARGRAGVRTIGFCGSFDVSITSSREDLVRAIEKKATRYGKIGVPYLVAVNRVSPLADDDDIGLAMFGNIGVRFDTRTGDSMEFRQPNGFW